MEQAREDRLLTWFRDLIYFVIFSFSMCLLAQLGLGPNWPWMSHLGAEYLCISKALLQGQGFSDPFTAPTGPTAWMPPLLPVLMAAIQLLIGEIGLLLVFCLGQIIVVSATLTCVVEVARRQHIVGWGIAAAILFALGEFHNLFAITHDSILILAMTVATLFVLEHYWGTRLSLKLSVGWGLWGGLIAHASPALALAWALMTVLAWRKSMRRLAITTLVSILCVTPWCYRNYVVFHHFVPMKSNVGFDAWQANVDDIDGLIGNANFQKHPWQNEGIHRQKIREMSEVGYSRSLGAEFTKWVIAHPRQYSEKVLRRLGSATLSIQEAGDASAGWGWLKSIVLALPWLTIPLAFSLHVFRVQIPKFYWISMGLITIYLVPYVLITYYDRYGAPLVATKAIMVIAFLGAVMPHIRVQSLIHRYTGTIAADEQKN